MTAVLLALALMASDPCAPLPSPAGPRDPDAARVYRQVADGERQAGALETAALAYREALARDPADAESRAALEALCTQRTTTPFQRGVAQMDAGEASGAARSFAEARAAGAGSSAALLEGISRYELGEDDAARTRLLEAREDPEHREAAELYLGLIALREGDGAAAVRALDVAGRDPQLAGIVDPLSRVARRTGRLVLAALASSGWDSNAQLAPSGTPIDTSNDGQFDLSGSALYRPLGESGPYVSGRGLFHQQFRFNDLDAWALGGAAGWQVGNSRRGALADYGYEYRTLAGAPFLSVHGPRAAGWTPVGPLTLGAAYYLRFESYDGTLYQPFSGTFQGGHLNASVPLSNRSRILFAYGLARDAVEQAQLSFLEHGPRAALRVNVASRGRLFVDAGLSWRNYDALDPQLGVTRSDTYLDGLVAFEWDLTPRTFLRATIEARQAWSNAPAFEYFRVAPTLGFGWVAGL